MAIQDIFGQMAEALGGVADGAQDIIADPQSALGGIAEQAIGDSGILDVAGGIGDNVAENVAGMEGLDPASIAEGLGIAPEGLEGIAGGLDGILEGVPVGEAADSLGSILEDSPLGGIVEGLGGFFGRG